MWCLIIGSLTMPCSTVHYSALKNNQNLIQHIDISRTTLYVPEALNNFPLEQHGFKFFISHNCSAYSTWRYRGHNLHKAHTCVLLSHIVTNCCAFLLWAPANIFVKRREFIICVQNSYSCMYVLYVHHLLALLSFFQFWSASREQCFCINAHIIFGKDESPGMWTYTPFYNIAHYLFFG